MNPAIGLGMGMMDLIEGFTMGRTMSKAISGFNIWMNALKAVENLTAK